MFKILVAEDDAELRQLFCRVLTRHGFQPIGAADGVEALQVLERDYIDLIVSDIMMPQLDGYALVRGLRDSGSTIPVLMITARDGFQDSQLFEDESEYNDFRCRCQFVPKCLILSFAVHLP